MNRRRAFSLIVVSVVLGAGAWAAARLPVTSDMGGFVPEADPELGEVSAALASSPLARMWIIAVGAHELAAAEATAKELGAALAASPDIEAVRTGVSEGEQDAFFRTYFAHRFGLAAPEAWDGPPSDEDLGRAAARLRHELGGPMGPLVRRIAPEDPLLSFLTFLEGVRTAGADAAGMGGPTLVSEDGKFALIVARTHLAPFNAEQAARVEAVIEGVREQAARKDPSIRILQSAVHRHAAASERAIKADMTRISVGSTVGMLLLFGVAFLSLRPLVLCFVPMLFGVAVGFVVTSLVFPAVHGITLAFGASLTGVCVDYSVHWIAHQTPGGGDSPDGRRVAMVAIGVGALTTALGLLGLGWTTFPGMREIALFAVVGIVSAVLATFWLVPLWLDAADVERALAPRLVPIRRGMAALGRRRGALLALLVVGCAPLLGLPRLTWSSSMQSLVREDPALVAEDEHARAAAGRHDGSRVIVVAGDTLEGALVRSESVTKALADHGAGSSVGTARALTSLLPSAAAQGAALAALRRDPDLDARLRTAFASAGIAVAAFRPFGELLEQAPGPITLAEVQQAGLGEWVQPFLLRLGGDGASPGGGRTLLAVFLRDVKSEAALKAALEPLGPDVRYFDQREFLSSAYGRFRQTVFELLIVGFLAIACIVGIRYRSLRLTAVALLPALASIAVFFGILGLLGMEANLMHLLGALLVLSMGEDYGVFVAEHEHLKASGSERTVFGVVLACGSTVLSFGLLGLSSEPSLRALGATVACALPLSAAFAVGALAWAEGAPPAAAHTGEVRS